MKLKFKNITKCSKKTYNDFLKFHNKKFEKKELIGALIFFLLILFIIIYNIKIGNFSLIIIIGVLILLLGFFYNIFHKQKEVEKEFKSSKIQNEEEIIYDFYNMYFDAVGKDKRQRLWYICLYRIYQDKNFFYFYTDTNHALLIDKKGFVKGDLSKFKEFISKRCIFKYRKYKRN